MDLQGRRYVDLPNAFAFQEAFDPNSDCRASPVLMTLLAERAREAVDPIVTTALPDREAFAPVPLPQPRPQPGEDPETTANRLGGFTPGVNPTPAGQFWSGLTNGPGVRLVGPAFYYAE